MTQDQYGQARDSGYVVSGQVVGDEQTEEFDDGQEKKMTTFQKVASALRGDRPDRDTPDQDVRENEGAYGQTPAGPDDLADPHGMATGQTAQDTFTPGTGTPDTFTPDTGTPDTFTPDTGAHETAGQQAGAFDAKDPSVGVLDPDRMSPEGAATGTSTARGDYWDTPDTRGTAQDHADAVISPDTTAADADADRLGQHDAVNAQDPTVTQPDVYETGASPDAMDADAATTGTMHADATNADAATTGAVNPDAVNTGPVTTGDATAGATTTGATTTGAMTTGAMTTGAGATAAYPQDGAATMPDVPVTDTPAAVAETEAAGTAGRHAAAPATELHPGEAPEELHPGEAAGSLDDLGDLAYGKLIPDAADFTAQWQQVQFKFVDDPQASVTEAAAIVEQVTAKMEAAIQERQRAIAERQQAIQEQQRSLRDRWGAEAQADTETLRATLRMYKAFLDQLVGPKA